MGSLSLALSGVLVALAAPSQEDAVLVPVGSGAASAPAVEETAAAAATGAVQELFGGLRITLFADVVGRRDDMGLFDADGENLDDRVYLRSFAARFEAPVAGIGRGVALARWSEQPDGDFETEVDEAYLELDPLRLAWEPLDERIAFRVGRFRAPIGVSNRWHDHELPQITRPLPVRVILGEEGLIQTALAFTVDVPTGTERAELLVTLEMARDFPLDESFTPLFDFDLFMHAGERDRLELGYTRDTSREEHDFGSQRRLRALDATWVHRAAAPDRGGAFLLGGEFLQSDVSTPAGEDRPSGWYAWGQVEVLPRWSLGARFDRSDALTDDSLETRTVGGYLGWRFHPQLRLAAGYEHTTSDDPALDGLDTLLAELTFSMGAAAPAPSWVSALGPTGPH